MGTRDPRVDAYIANSADFAKPILAYIREVIHSACPEVEETLKWRSPHFMYNGMLAGMAAFKEHCAFGFWKGSLLEGSPAKGSDAMGQFGRIEKVSDLPSKKVLTDLTKQAMRLNDEGTKVKRVPKKTASKKFTVPADLAAALAKSRKAEATFDAFSPSNQREYVEWI